ncbi:MAG TPA: VOC family protein [Burkholderiales bacterium]|nr:VOC family protein [Burkholderiales bacterium]
MSKQPSGPKAAAQVPDPGKLNLDHVAHFVPHIDAASNALEKLGFTLTPFSAQSHRLQPEGPLVPAGTGNRCVMLQRGYLEFLTPTGDTPVADQLRASIRRYVGVHLVAFGTGAPDLDHARLANGGFAPLAPVALQRPVATEHGEDTARFTVVRVAPGTMAEGRIQFVQQHTPNLLWQPRWIAHPNRATALAGVVICAADPWETARRYARFTGLPPRAAGQAWRLDTARGYLLFAAPDTLERHLGVAPPALPWIAGYVLQSGDIDASGDYLRGSGGVDVMDKRRLRVTLPAALGGIIIFEPAESDVLGFD